jgi:hypothetical protein
MLSMQTSSISGNECNTSDTINKQEAQYYYNNLPSLNQLNAILSTYCFCIESGTEPSRKQQVSNIDSFGYWNKPMVQLPSPFHNEISESTKLSGCGNQYLNEMPRKTSEEEYKNIYLGCSFSTPQTSKPLTDESLSDTLMKEKRDMINYEALEGHQYEILPNPNKYQEKNTRVFVCKYDN